MNRRNANTSVDNDSEATSVRPKRIAVGLRPKLSLIGKDPNFEYRIVNDTPGRVSMFKHGGWELCTNEEVDTGNYRAEEASEVGSLASYIVDGGTGQKAYAMKIKKEWYEAFMNEYNAEVDRTEETLRPNLNDGGYGEVRIDRSGRK
jgi:hypothetical protein